MFEYNRVKRINLDDASDFMLERFPGCENVDVVVQFGSGQTSIELLDECWARFPLQELPHIPNAESVLGHKLEVQWGRLGDLKVMVFAGRYHLYEGLGVVPCVLPIWTACNCGARNFVFSSAAGSINRHLGDGGLMLMTDYINNLGISPLVGHQHLIQSPFIDMSEPYDADLLESFVKAAGRADVPISKGVYMANLGPEYETASELEMAKTMGADVVGTSIVLETIAARAMGARVLGVAMIKNYAYALRHKTPYDTQAAGKIFRGKLSTVLNRWLRHEAPPVLTGKDD